MLDSSLFFDPPGTAITSTAVSANVLDMLGTQDVGIGTPLRVAVVSNLAFAADGAATLQIQLQGASDNYGVPGGWDVYAQTEPLTIAQLNSLTFQNGSLVGFMLPTRGPNDGLPRFYRLNYVVATGPFTAGGLQSMLTPARASAPQYPAGVIVQN
ncbi:MAG TPA: hypothetical protein VND19_06465 [Acetobacteraceae bacterium]|nr:hypothetical protein [Acetobacteraceae bacterium]